MKNLIIWSVVFVAYTYTFSYVASVLFSEEPNWWRGCTVGFMFIGLLIITRNLILSEEDYTNRKKKK